MVGRKSRRAHGYHTPNRQSAPDLSSSAPARACVNVCREPAMFHVRKTMAAVHLIFLVGLRNRLLVLFQWAWSYLTFGRGARLIYGSFKARKEPVPEASDVAGLV